MDDLSQEQKADKAALEAYRAASILHEELYGKGTFAAQAENNNALGRHSLQRDLGLFNEPSSLMFGDSLDNTTRDRLISNTRQDVAVIYNHARDAFEAAFQARAIARKTAFVTLAIFCINLLILLAIIKLWWQVI